MQIISKDRTVGNITMNVIKEFNNQSLATQVKKAEQLVSMMAALKKVFDLMGDDIVDLSTEKWCFKN